MKSTFLRLTLLAILCTTCLVVIAQETLDPQAGAVLLRNGEVLEGRVSFEGDYCTIILTRGEIRVRRDQTRAVEANIDDIYRKHIIPHTPAGPEGSLERADWCLRHGLIGYAAGQITEASKHIPNDPRLAVLRERLATARRPTKLKPAPTKDHDGRMPPASTTLATQHHAASLDSKSLEAFTVAVQPLLLNRCATAGCHGKSSNSDYRLERGIEGRAILRRTTLANLESTLNFVDRKRPAASPLLTTPIRPHAHAKQAIFLAAHRKQYDLLVGWVEQLRQTSASAPVATQSPPAHKQPRGIDSGTKTLGRHPSAPHKTHRVHQPPSANTNPKANHTPKPVADPFDPERFNRRYFKPEKSKGFPAAHQPSGVPADASH